MAARKVGGIPGPEKRSGSAGRRLAGIAGRDGWEAAVLFVAQRSDVDRVVAAHEIDPGFAEALAAAREAGVRVLARRCGVTTEEVRLGPPVPAGAGDAGR